MSFSFSAAGKTKGETKSRAAHAFSQCVVDQRAHDADRHLVLDAVEQAIDVLGEPADGETVAVTAYGSASLEYFAGGATGRVMACQFTVNAHLAKP